MNYSVLNNAPVLRLQSEINLEKNMTKKRFNIAGGGGLQSNIISMLVINSVPDLDSVVIAAESRAPIPAKDHVIF